MQSPAIVADFEGPGRFCGYAPIIDLVSGESIELIDGGIHSGSFRWIGPFGELEVHGIGWASPPKHFKPSHKNSKGQTVFFERRVDGKNVIALWNGRDGAAYFYSVGRLTRPQRDAIDRVDLFQEGEDPVDCRYCTIGFWE
jgi:hypothetical protein